MFNIHNKEKNDKFGFFSLSKDNTKKYEKFLDTNTLYSTNKSTFSRKEKNKELKMAWELPLEENQSPKKPYKSINYNPLSQIKNQNKAKIFKTNNNLNIKTNKNNIRLTKHDLKILLNEINDQAVEEISKKEKINKMQDSLDQFVETATLQSNHQNNNKLALTKNELKDVLKNYEKKISRNKKSKEEQFMEQWIEYYESMSEYYRKYFEFQNLLWFYYKNEPEMYQQIMDDYNLRRNREYLVSLGIDDKFYKGSKEQILNKIIPKELIENQFPVHKKEKYGFIKF